VNADTHVNLFGLVFFGVVRPQLGVNLLRTLHSVDDGGKVDQERIADGFDHVAVMGIHRLVDELIVDLKQSQHPGFICTDCLATAVGVPASQVSMATQRLRQDQRFAWKVGVCSRCSAERTVIRAA